MNIRMTCSASAAAFALGLGALALAPVTAQAQISIGISVGVPPPYIPDFDQPPLPDYGYIWTPGYWAWDGDYGDYYWVPGEWVRPPRVGYLWTPGYWGWRNNGYFFNSGYWGRSVGYYGGVDYGYGYGGRGYQGGEWRQGRLFYNRDANNIGGARIATVFSRPVAPRGPNRVSYNGGRGGLAVRPTPVELAASRGPHVQATPIQTRLAHTAATNPALRAKTVTAGGAAGAAVAMRQVRTQAGAPAATRRAATPNGAMAPNPARGDTMRPGRTPTAPGAATMRPGRAPNTAGTEATHRGRNVITPGPETMPNARTQRMQTGRPASTMTREAPPAARVRQVAPRSDYAPRNQMAPRNEMAPSRQMAPRNDTMRPGGMNGPMNGGGRPMGGEAMRPQPSARPVASPQAREPAARPAAQPQPGKADERKPPN